jgi:tetratricopeptide (TPR) repeat protein
MPLISSEVVESLINAALAAHKSGSLSALPARRPRAWRWFSRRWLGPVLGTAGEGLRGEQGQVEALALLLRWSALQLRPEFDREPAAGDRQSWLERTSWRPALAVLCHFGFVPVPDFPDRYRRRADESPADNLCGLWAVGPSTFYRYLDKGKRLMAEGWLAHPLAGARRLSLRQMVQHELARRGSERGAEQSATWHHRQAELALARRDAASAIWHHLQAADPVAFTQSLQRFRTELSRDAETDLLVDQMLELPLSPRQSFDLQLAMASLWRMRNAEERERQAYESALRIATTHDDKLMLGIVYGALGRFHEPRDTDRALACFEDSADFLRQARAVESAQPGTGLEEYVAALVRLAWLYVLRNDPRSRAVLDKAEAARADPAVSADNVALLEQTWGEYWRRAGEPRRAIEHKHKALNIFERLGDTRQILSTYNNLSLIYGEAKEFDRAVEYARRVVAMAEQTSVDPYILTSSYLNMGVAHYLQGQYDEAIEMYRAGLDHSVRARLAVHVNRAHYNLAEAYYKRFSLTGVVGDEQLGDAHAAAALKASPAEGDLLLQQAARGLKAEILGAHDGLVNERLLPEEFAAHFDEMADVQRQRAILAVPVGTEAHVKAHLAVARSYLAIAGKEREAALSLIQKHGLGDRFVAEFEQLRNTFNRELTREQQLATHWEREAGELLQEQRRIALLEHLFRAGSIQKSMYAKVCGVGLATASKHLSTLAQLGLLEQTGNGPSTRYVLPP